MDEVKKFDSTGLKYRFNLKINDQIICQRYFDIFNYNPDVIYSRELKNDFDKIVNMIREDLMAKTRVYLYHVCPTFADEEKLKKYQENGLYTSELWTEMDDEFKIKKGEKNNENENTLTFDFDINGKTIMTKSWSADEYPKFIRNSIDICNHQYIQVTTPTSSYKIYFKTADENQMKYEHTIKKRIHVGREDLVPKIIKIFRDVCSTSSEDLDLEYHPKNFGYKY
jgi:hypothetical protein